MRGLGEGSLFVRYSPIFVTIKTGYMRFCMLLLVVGIAALGTSSCRKHEEQPVGQHQQALPDAVYVYRSQGKDASAYKFFYDSDGFVVKILVNDIHGLAENLTTDSLEYDGGHKLQKVIFTSVNGRVENDYLYDSGRVSKIIFGAGQGTMHYMYLVYGMGNRVAAMGDAHRGMLHPAHQYLRLDSGVSMADVHTIDGGGGGFSDPEI